MTAVFGHGPRPGPPPPTTYPHTASPCYYLPPAPPPPPDDVTWPAPQPAWSWWPPARAFEGGDRRDPPCPATVWHNERATRPDGSRYLTERQTGRQCCRPADHEPGECR